ncbi:MAG: HlyD family efflux transporter periplasmic adaptor subunit [Bacteroidota bacterium]
MNKYIYSFTLLILMGISATSCSQQECAEVKRTDIIDAVFASGQLIPDEEYLVTANTESYLLEAFVEEGDTVKKGMPLFVLSNESQAAQLTNAEVTYIDAQRKLKDDSPQIRQMELQIAQAQSQLTTDKNNLSRYEKLVETGAVSQVEYDKARLQFENSKHQLEIQEESLAELLTASQLNLQNAETQLILQQEGNRDFFLASAIHGQVLTVYKTQGDLVRRGESVAQVGGGELVMKLFIAEEDINRIKVGQEAMISLNTDPDNVHKARISKIFPSFDTQEQSFMAEAVFEEFPSQLFPYTQIQANIIINTHRNALVVPTAYLTDGTHVLLEDGSSQEVEIGLQQADWTEVLSGLTESQVILLPENN